jgi:hypothetical protein
MITKSKVIGALVGVAALAAVSQANAYPMYFQNVTLEGTPLETTAGFTDPALTGDVGELFTIGFGIVNMGNPSPWWGTVTLDFTAGPGSTLSIADWSASYPSLPTTFSYSFSFAAYGLFDGTLTIDVVESNPDYDVPGPGGAVETRTFPFSITIDGYQEEEQYPTPSIPEPGMLALFGLALAGIGVARRRKSA